MAKREIRISLFYTDLFVFDFARAKKRQDEMIKGANEFFGRYRLRVDTFPFPYNYTAYKEAFVLREHDGIRPDVGMDRLAQHMREDTERSEALSAEESDPNTTAARRAELRVLRKQLDAQVRARVWEGFNRTAEHDFRMALADRFARHKILKKYAREWKKAPRLAVILCEFVNLPQRSKLNRDAIGQYLPALGRDTVAGYRMHKKPIPAFRQPYVMMDVREAGWSTLAHEIVHGNGHVHPEAYGEHAGYYDGPQESIMNYFSHGMKPSEAILEDSDLKALEAAFFVRE